MPAFVLENSEDRRLAGPAKLQDEGSGQWCNGPGSGHRVRGVPQVAAEGDQLEPSWKLLVPEGGLLR